MSILERLSAPPRPRLGPAARPEPSPPGSCAPCRPRPTPRSRAAPARGPGPVPDLLDRLLDAEDGETGRRMDAATLREKPV